MCQHSHTQTHNKRANRFSTEREKQRRVLPLPLRGEPPSTEGLSSLPAVINTSPLSEVDDKQLLINHRLGALGSSLPRLVNQTCTAYVNIINIYMYAIVYSECGPALPFVSLNKERRLCGNNINIL